MTFIKTKLPGVMIIEIEPQTDERGFFARVFCAEEFAQHGLNGNVAQSSVSFNHHKGTLRGMHWQSPPHAEDKLVRCTAGSIFDVVVDIGADSPHRGQWYASELSAENRKMLYIPRGYAHGFLTLANNTEIFYQISTPYAPSATRGFRWDDPDVAIKWPLAPTVISARDRTYPNLREVIG